MRDKVAVYVDDEGQKWHACLFAKPMVGSWMADDPESVDDLATVVFERPGEELVTFTTMIRDWDSKENLHKLFQEARDRRSVSDRRVGQERRAVTRRAATLRAPAEKRGRADRRHTQRRSGRNRREADEGPVTFTSAAASQIRDLALDPMSQLLCPECDVSLTVGPKVEWAGSVLRELCCPSCFRCMMVKNMPDRS